MDRFTAGNDLNIGNALSAVATGPWYRSVSTVKTYSIQGKTSGGAGTATVQIIGSTDGITPDATIIGTVTLTLGVVPSSDGFTSTDRYKYVAMRVTGLTGAGAQVTGTIGY